MCHKFKSNHRSAPPARIAYRNPMNANRPSAKCAPDERFTTETQRWLALQQRDPAANGQFVYAVLSTRIFCRPNCPSKLASRENVTFFTKPEDAAKAGFRPCKRCQPTDLSLEEQHAAAAARACRLIEGSDTFPPLQALAQAAGLSPFHFHRVFKNVVGVTPRQYAAAHRTRRVRTGLRGTTSITDAIYGAGYNSNSRFYERAPATLGMTPTHFRRGGAGITIQYAVAPCPLGLVLVAGTAVGVCSVTLGNDPAELEQTLRAAFSNARIEKAGKDFKGWVQAVVRQISRPAARAEVPLDIRGTAFQQRVWQALREIPPGQTATYAEIAAKIGHPSAVRAVGTACGANPAAVLVPCHRALRTDGKLGGYRWGLERKKRLLEKEKDIRK